MAASNILGINDIATFEPKKQHLWIMKFEDINTILSNIEEGKNWESWAGKIPGLDKVSSIVGSYQDGLTVSLLSATRPTFTYEVITINRLNKKMHFASKPSEDRTLSVSFVDTIYSRVAEILYLWNKIIYNRVTGGMGFKEQYASDKTFLYLLTPDGKVIEAWRFLGLFPAETNFGEQGLNYGETGNLTVAVTFRYDDVFRADLEGDYTPPTFDITPQPQIDSGSKLKPNVEIVYEESS